MRLRSVERTHVVEQILRMVLKIQTVAVIEQVVIRHEPIIGRQSFGIIRTPHIQISYSPPRNLHTPLISRQCFTRFMYTISLPTSPSSAPQADTPHTARSCITLHTADKEFDIENGGPRSVINLESYHPISPWHRNRRRPVSSPTARPVSRPRRRRRTRLVPPRFTWQALRSCSRWSWRTR